MFIAKQFSDTPLSIPQELKKADLIYEADEIGFVFPDYAAAVPVFDMNEQIRIDKNTDENMAGIISDISAHKDFIAPSDMGWFTEEMLQGMQEMYGSMPERKFCPEFRRSGHQWQMRVLPFLHPQLSAARTEP